MDKEIVYRIGRGNQGLRLDEYLHQRIPRLSFAGIHELIRTRVLCSWEEQPDPQTQVKPGGQVIIRPMELAEVALDLDLTVLYEDEDLIAVDKPPGLVTHPTAWVRQNALTSILERKCQRRLFMAHRLDKGTSGVFLMAKRKEGAAVLHDQFRRRAVKKIYIALVHGKVRQGEMHICQPLSKPEFSPHGLKRGIAQNLFSGEFAVTDFTSLAVNEKFSLLQVEPKTGRSHQIRVHLAAMQHPIVGDTLYQQIDYPAARMFLHAKEMYIMHPRQNRRLRLQAELPAAYQEFFHDAEN